MSVPTPSMEDVASKDSTLLAAVAELGAALISGGPTSAALQRAVAILGEAAQPDRLTLYEVEDYDETGITVSIAAEWRSPAHPVDPVPPEVRSGRFPFKTRLGVLNVLLAGSSAVMSRSEIPDHVHGTLDRLGVAALHLTPVFRHQKLVAVLVVQSFSEEKTWNPSVVAGFHISARLLAAAYERESDHVELQVARSGLRLVAETVPMGTYSLNPALGMCSPTPELASLLHLSDAQGLTLADYHGRIHPADRDELASKRARAIETQSSLCARYRLTVEGAYRWVEERAGVLTRSDGTKRLVGAVLVIDEMVREQAKLEERHAFMSTIVANAATLLWVIEHLPCGEMIFSSDNAAFQPMFSTSLEPYLGQPIDKMAEVFSAKVVENWKHHQRECLKINDVYSYEDEFSIGEGATYLRVRLRPLPPDEKGVTRVIGSALDVTAQRQAETALRETQRMVERIGHLAPFHVYIFDLANWANVFSNWSVESVLGYPEGTLPVDLRKQMQFTLHPVDYEVMLKAPQDWCHAPDGQVRIRYWRSRHANGTWRTFRALETPINRNEDGCVSHILGLSEDVTERLNNEQELKRLTNALEHRVIERTQELEAANRDLESFAYSVSHDLRGPVRGVSLWAGLLRTEHGNELSADALDAVRRIEKSAHRMAALIDALLQLTRWSRSGLDPQPFSMSALVREVLAHHESAAPGRGLKVEVQPNVPAVADPVLVRAVLDNLIGNAVKFTSTRKAPVIRFSAREEGRQWVYAISDNGVGFDMRFASNLFKPFSRLHQDQEFPGSGIGLATTQRIIERHGGRIWAESELDKGATFFFTLSKAQTNFA